jgi:hypothetical protein
LLHSFLPSAGCSCLVWLQRTSPMSALFHSIAIASSVHFTRSPFGLRNFTSSTITALFRTCSPHHTRNIMVQAPTMASLRHPVGLG